MAARQHHCLLPLLTCLLLAGCSGDDSLTSPPTPGSGDLDVSFSGDGVASYDSTLMPGGDDVGYAAALDSSGKPLAAGTLTDGSGNRDAAVWRYTTAGLPDSTFGADYGSDGQPDGFNAQGNDAGFISRDDGASAMAVDGNGRILLAGYSSNTQDNSDLSIWRFTTAGALDTTFAFTGVPGNFTHNGAAGFSGNDAGRAIAVDSSLRIVVAGFSHNGNDYDLALWRLTDSGVLDTTFGGDYDSNGTPDGYVIHHNAAGGNGNDFAYALAVDGSSNIVVAGSSMNPSGNSDLVVWRFTSAGNLDTTFGADYDSSGAPDGYVIQEGAGVAAANDVGYAIALDGTGKIVVAGGSYATSTGDDMVVWRFTPIGVLDNTFNTTGYLRYNRDNDSDSGRAIAIDGSGRIVVAGNSGGDDMTVWRLASDGTLDSSFGNNGAAVTTGLSGDRGYGLTLDASGNIVVVGQLVKNNSYDLALWRLVP